MQLENVNTDYSKVAKHYDWLLNFWFGNILHIEKYREIAVERLHLNEGDIVLDIGCGTGANFSQIEKKIGKQGQIIGVDYTPAMLHFAHQKIEKNNWNNITLIQGDAVKINELVKTRVDAIISTYCFSILYDVKIALLNALSPLKSNGSIVLLDIKRMKPQNKLAKIIYPVYGAIARKYGIISSEEMNDEVSSSKWEALQHTFKSQLINIELKEFLLNTFFILKGEKP